MASLAPELLWAISSHLSQDYALENTKMWREPLLDLECALGF